MADVSSNIPIIILDVNSLNKSIKRYISIQLIKNSDPIICCFQEAHFKYNNIGRVKVIRLEKIHHANINRNKYSWQY